ncbi:MAG: hypothetical protein LBQ94_08015 [Treponema sp.]|jgi:hypothetical protein|nr:hypothetical protein [Treponema sp.]
MCKKKVTVTFLLMALTCSVSFAFDFGLILDQNGDYGGYGSKGSFGYSLSLIPRFSALLGTSADFYLSAGIRASYADGADWRFVPELLRTELSFYTGSLDFKAGRMYHSDPLGLIADGLFDGVKLSLDSEAGTFSLGAWYTGLLYKNRANILMTTADRELYLREFDFADFANTYFAPPRVVSSLGWERLSLGGPLQARAAVLAQFDLGRDASLSSQYLAAKLSLPGYIFGFDLGGILELIEKDGFGGDLEMAAAAELGFHLTPSTRLPQRLSLLGRYSSGGLAGDFIAYNPVTTKAQGEILKAGLSGISLVSLDYLIRPANTFSAGLISTCFIRSDLETYGGYPISGKSGGYFLGTEFFGMLLWNPLSDLQVNLGGGVFMPSLGDANPGADVSWRAELNIIVSFF